MILQHIRHAFRLIKEAPVLSTIAILGTTLAISMALVVMMIRRIETAPIYPEAHPDRSMYVSTIQIYERTDSLRQNAGSGPLNGKFAREFFKDLPSVEAMALYSYPLPCNVQLANTPPVPSLQRYVSVGFWQVHEFSFLDGAPFSEADYDSGLSKVVISERVAREIFGKVDVSGQEIYINYSPFTITGVVRSVSPMADDTNADVWIPQTLLPDRDGDLLGDTRVIFLLKSPRDKEAFRAEIDRRVELFNQNPINERNLTYMGQPDDAFVHSHRYWSNVAPDMGEVQRTYWSQLLLLILIPCINLAAIMTSRMRKRVVEIGVRRAYGATRLQIILQVIAESFVQTLISGILGLFFSALGLYFLRSLLFSSFDGDLYYDAGDTFLFGYYLSPWPLLISLLLCFVITLVTMLVPAWQAARRAIVPSLTSKR